MRSNLREDCFGAILMDRGDRFSWTGDAYTAQAASLVAFSNYEAVLKNLNYTESHRNGIETYELYWVESVADYFVYTGDADGVRALLPAACSRLDHAAHLFDNPHDLCYVGWDERLGTGFDNPDCEENKRTYQMLAIGAWKHFADKVLDRIGERERAERYRRIAAEKTARLLASGDYVSRLGMHASADAINAGFLPDLRKLYHPDLSDRLQRLSYSPFNQCFLLQAMARAGHYDDAFASIFDQWGAAIEYGCTCGFEVYRPDWNAIFGKNGTVPFTQAGNTSLAHPWGAGVLAWLSEEMLGVKPVEPGFAKFSVKPHFNGFATRVKGCVMTPHGAIDASFDLKTGRHSITVPKGTVASVAIPKEGMSVKSVTFRANEGNPVVPRVIGTTPKHVRDGGDFLCIDDLPAGRYDFTVKYEGEPRKARKEEYVYAAKFIGEDRETHGEWWKKFGTKGYLIVGGGEG